MNEAARDWALDLARLGFRVFPLYGVVRDDDGRLIDELTGDEATRQEGSGKRPRLKWKDEATTDCGVIERWWEIWPDSNVGVCTGEGLAVVDCDSQEAVESFLSVWVDQEAGDWLETFSVDTPRGKHFYLRGETATFKPAPETDMKGRGGYVVGPGSVGWSGAVYEPSLVRGEVHLERLPEWCAKVASRRAEDVSGDGLIIKDGDRNNALTRVAGYLARLGFPPHLNKDVIARVNETCCMTPLRIEELEDTLFKSIDTWELGQTVDDVIEVEALLRGRAADDQESLERFYMFESDRRMQRRPEWVYNELIPEYGLCQLYGKSYTGKTFVAVDLALSLVNGRDWMGFNFAGVKGRNESEDITRDHVLYVLAEGSFDFQDRLDAWTKLHGGSSGKLITVQDQNINLGSRDGWGRMGSEMLGDERVAAVWDRLGLVVLDTQSLLMGDADENSNTDMNKCMGVLKRVSVALGCPILLVHHEGNSDGGLGRGASAVYAAMDTVMRIKETRGARSMEVKKVKAAAKREGDILFDLVAEEDGPSAAVTSDVNDELRQMVARRDETLGEVRAYLAEHGATDWSTIRQNLGVIRQSARDLELQEHMRDSGWFQVTGTRRGSPIWDLI